ncbi:MAG: Xaa-Pro peptidase family protein [Calditrichia bacterium]
MLIKEKVEQAKQLLQEFEVDCWITFVRESQLNGDPLLAFFSPGDVTWHSAFVISRNGPSFAVVGRYDKQTIEETGAFDEVVGFVEGFRKPLQTRLKKMNPRQIAVNYSVDSEICDGITHGMFLTLQQTLKEIGMADRIISAERLVSALRERKSEAELKAIRTAIAGTERIFEEVRKFIRPGMSELQVGQFMKEKVRDRGLELAWDERVCPSVFSGPATAEAHYTPTKRKILPGHVMNMDFGVKVDGYCSDMQRTFYIRREGEETVPEEVRHGFQTIVSAVEEAKKAMKPGVTGEVIDKISRDIVVGNGYEEFPHALGHQVGRFSHDGTALLGPTWEKYASKPLKPLESGMVFTIEPRLTVKEYGIVTIEEMVLVTDTGCEWLSHPQKDLWLI